MRVHRMCNGTNEKIHNLLLLLDYIYVLYELISPTSWTVQPKIGSLASSVEIQTIFTA